MRVLLSFIFFLFFAAEIKAQVATTSLYITLSDIQSVKIIELPDRAKAGFTEKNPGKSNVRILNSSSSQIRKFESQIATTEFGIQENIKGSQKEMPVANGSLQLANLNLLTNKSIPLVVYQIDPR